PPSALFGDHSRDPPDLHSFPTRRSSDLGLKSLTLDDLKAHAQRVFTRGRVVVGLAGGADPALEQRMREGLAALPAGVGARPPLRSEEHTSELQSLRHLVCRLLLEKKKKK